LVDDAFWANMGAIAGGMTGHAFEGLGGPAARELHHQLQDAIRDVERDARWDQAHWDAASAKTPLEDDEVAAGECPACLPELQSLTARGLLPPELQGLADVALQRYRENDPAAA
jgi:hypothetical protein